MSELATGTLINQEYEKLKSNQITDMNHLCELLMSYLAPIISAAMAKLFIFGKEEASEDVMQEVLIEITTKAFDT